VVTRVTEAYSGPGSTHFVCVAFKIHEEITMSDNMSEFAKHIVNIHVARTSSIGTISGFFFPHTMIYLTTTILLFVSYTAG
jgi:hypothetical protein